MVIAQETFRDEEYAHPKEVFESRGAKVTTASVEAGPCRGRFGLPATADVALSQADPQVYDAVVFVGGGGAAVFFDDPAAHALARTMFDAGKVVSAICIAPSVLGHAGLLAGVRVTSFPSQEQDLRKSGAIWTGNPVQVDGRIITGNGPEAAYDFANAVANAMGLSPA